MTIPSPNPSVIKNSPVLSRYAFISSSVGLFNTAISGIYNKLYLSNNLEYSLNGK